MTRARVVPAHVAATLSVTRCVCRVVTDALNRSRRRRLRWPGNRFFQVLRYLFDLWVEMPCSWRVEERDMEEDYMGRAECSGRRFNLEM